MDRGASFRDGALNDNGGPVIEAPPSVTAPPGTPAGLFSPSIKSLVNAAAYVHISALQAQLGSKIRRVESGTERTPGSGRWCTHGSMPEPGTRETRDPDTRGGRIGCRTCDVALRCGGPSA